MIEAIKRIGEYAVEGNLTQDAFLNGICQKLETDRPFKQYIIILNFNIKNNKIEIEPVNVKDGDSEKEYLWIGDTIRKKLYCPPTTRRIDRILTTTLPEIEERINGDIKTDIGRVLKEFFKIDTDGKYNIIPEKFDFFEKKVKEIVHQAEKIKKSLKEENPEKKETLEEKERQFKGLWKEATGSTLKLTNKRNKELINEIEQKCIFLLDHTTELLNKKYEELENLIADIVNSKGFQYEYTNNKPVTRSPNISIYTIKINNRLICQTNEYKKVLVNEKVSSLFNNSKKFYQNKSTCSICGENNKETTSDSTNLEFAFYVRDKIGFSSNLDGRFTKNYNICKDCYQYLMIGETSIDNNLKTQIGMVAYIIPHLIYNVNNLNIEDFSKYVKASTNSIVNLRSLKESKKELEKYSEYGAKKNNFVINYLFYRPSAQSDFKILKLIKDVPPIRLDFIRRKEEEIINLVNSDYDGNKNLKVDLEAIWGCIPIKKGERGSYSGYSRYLDIIDAVFSDNRVEYSFLINQFAEVIRIIKFKRNNYNILDNKNEMNQSDYFTNKLLQFNFLLLFFKKLNALGGADMIETSNMVGVEVEELLPKQILDYWKGIEIYKDDRKKSLFILGYLIGEIGNAQSISGHEKMPILNKINFQGIGLEKLGWLSGQVVEKLRQYNKWQFNKDIYSAHIALMDRNKMQWKLSNQENLFYILSGFAFSNYLVRKRSKDKYFEKKKIISEYIEKAKEDGKNIEKEEITFKEANELEQKGRYSEGRKILEKIEIPNKDKEVK